MAFRKDDDAQETLPQSSFEAAVTNMQTGSTRFLISGWAMKVFEFSCRDAEINFAESEGQDVQSAFCIKWFTTLN